ncbi:hypothetical protein HZS_3239 [Henneguya salminicola]|nr:hypothetical protein HZS_3239 [Henneguya salminicola]
MKQISIGKMTMIIYNRRSQTFMRRDTFLKYNIIETTRMQKKLGKIARIIEDYNRGNRWQKIKKVFKHHKTTVHNVIKRYILKGEIENKPRVTRP